VDSGSGAQGTHSSKHLSAIVKMLHGAMLRIPNVATYTAMLTLLHGPELLLDMQVQQLAPSQIEEQLKLAVGQLMSKPPAAMQALLDHSHDSYAKDLEAAAKQLTGTKRHKGPTSNTSTAAA